MSACHEIQKLLPISPGDIPPDEYRRITEHLASCPECSRMQEHLHVLEDASVELEIADPGDKYWESFADRVRRQAAIQEVAPRSNSIQRFIFRPAFGWPAAAAALVLVFFISSAIIQDGEMPPTQPQIQQTELSGRVGEPLGPGDEMRPSEVEIATIEPRFEPETAQRQDDQQVVDAESASEQLAEASGTKSSGEAGKLSDTIEPQESESRISTGQDSPGELAMSAGKTEDEGLPRRQTIILRGDTDETKLIDKGLPSGKDLASVERPNAPLPVNDTLTSTEAERLLGVQGTQDYIRADSQTPPLNRSVFTEEDRVRLQEQIKELTRDVDEKKGHSREKACRELVDKFYQLAVHWQVQSDIRQAVEFMEEARGILPPEDLPDLTSKEAALKSLLDK